MESEFCNTLDIKLDKKLFFMKIAWLKNIYFKNLKQILGFVQLSKV